MSPRFVFASLSLLLLASTAQPQSSRDTDVPRNEQPPPKPPTRLSAKERMRLEEEAQKLRAQAEELAGQGQITKALELQRRSLAMNQQLYPAAEYHDGHSELAVCLNNMGVLHSQLGQLEEAGNYLMQALAMYHKLYPQAKYPNGHLQLATSLDNLGHVLQAAGRLEEACGYMLQALTMEQKLYPRMKYPDGHIDLANGLNNLGYLLYLTGQLEVSRGYLEQALVMHRKLYPKEKYPNGHHDIAANLNNLSSVLSSAGQLEEARAYLEQSLAIQQKLHPKAKYPNGHIDIAIVLHNMGHQLISEGRLKEAHDYLERTLAMLQQLFPKAKYPNGHPILARCLNGLGIVLDRTGQLEESRSCFERALAMQKRCYPKAKYHEGHSDIAESLNNLGTLLGRAGRTIESREWFEQALAMNQRLYPRTKYPDGHVTLASNLNSLGILLKDEKRLAEALTMYDRLARRYALTAAESEVLDLLRQQPRARYAYLSVSRIAKTPAAQIYHVLWQSRALATRVLARRQQAVRLALHEDTTVRRTWADLLDTRRQLAGLARRPGIDAAYRDREMTRLDRHKTELERQLARLIPQLSRDQVIDGQGSNDLVKLLPKGAVFIDLYRYSYDEKAKTLSRYCAFVVRPDGDLRRVELGAAGPIDDAARAWRAAIAKGTDTLADAAKVGGLTWAPLAKELPTGTTVVYLAPDSELARLPWAALPGTEKGTVLLEEIALAVVPHGPFLLEQLRRKSPPSEKVEAVLALGGVDYGPAKASGYSPLPGTSAELHQLAALAGNRTILRLEGKQATWTALSKQLPQARYAHLATHGFYDAKALAIERRLRQQSWQRTSGEQTRGRGARSPLAFTGLALAGANDPKGDGLVTGEALVGLPLDHLYLCVLSACESGLGDLGPVAGEPAQGLPRALHLAGCRNVISSLWNVNDKATAALMARFYHELWVAKRPPLEALRLAQLTILRHPGRIDDLADRGRPDFAKTVRLPADPATSRQRAATRLWAAFVLSGTGR